MKIDLKNCVIKIKDGSATPKSITLKLGSGNLSFTEHSEHTYENDRGKLDTVRKGDEQPMELNIEAILEWYSTASGETTPTIMEALKKKGAASDWVSSDKDDACAPYAVDVEMIHTPECGTFKETYLFPKFRADSKQCSINDGQIQIAGKCNVLEPTVTKAAIP